MAEELVIDSGRCKGCYYCVAACPRKALSAGKQLNASGYAYVQLDKSLCTACGVCYIVCPDYALSIEEGGQN